MDIVCHMVQLNLIAKWQVSMGDDAIAINNLLLEVIRPYVARLCAIGVLHNRDSATVCHSPFSVCLFLYVFFL